jgi:hypothetical protein
MRLARPEDIGNILIPGKKSRPIRLSGLPETESRRPFLPEDIARSCYVPRAESADFQAIAPAFPLSLGELWSIAAKVDFAKLEPIRPV